MDAAAIAIATDGENVLWVKRRDLGIWVLPGGGIDQGETPEMAVLRELQEETGIIGKIEKKAALLRPLNRLSSPTHLFLCSYPDKTHFPKETEEASEIGLFPFHMPPSPHFPLHQDWILEVKKSDHYFERELSEITLSKIALFLITHPGITLRYLWGRVFGLT